MTSLSADALGVAERTMPHTEQIIENPGKRLRSPRAGDRLLLSETAKTIGRDWPGSMLLDTEQYKAHVKIKLHPGGKLF